MCRRRWLKWHSFGGNQWNLTHCHSRYGTTMISPCSKAPSTGLNIINICHNCFETGKMTMCLHFQMKIFFATYGEQGVIKINPNMIPLNVNMSSDQDIKNNILPAATASLIARILWNCECLGNVWSTYIHVLSSSSFAIKIYMKEGMKGRVYFFIDAWATFQLNGMKVIGRNF